MQIDWNKWNHFKPVVFMEFFSSYIWENLENGGGVRGGKTNAV